MEQSESFDPPEYSDNDKARDEDDKNDNDSIDDGTDDCDASDTLPGTQNQPKLLPLPIVRTTTQSPSTDLEMYLKYDVIAKYGPWEYISNVLITIYPKGHKVLFIVRSRPLLWQP